MKGKPPKVPTEILKQAYEAGATLRELARQYGISFQTINMQLKHAGVAMRHTWSLRQVPDTTICKGCGIEFTPGHLEQRYHSQACWSAHKKGIRYKTHCVHGHPLFGSNLYQAPSAPYPRCRQCIHANQAKWRQRRKEQKV